MCTIVVALVVTTGCASTAAGVFRITPQRPVAELRTEAHGATPPIETGKRPADLLDLAALDPSIKLDIRYATNDNFLSTPLYTQARAYMQRPAAEALLRAHRALASHGYGLLIHDAYRPWWVTKVFWEATPPDLREFVADPARGSRHNRGCAVDLTLYNLATGKPVEMPSRYDEMSKRSYPTYIGGDPERRARRDLLRRVMEQEGFAVYEAEWWHFDHKDWNEYPILNVDFEDLSAAPSDRRMGNVDALFSTWNKPDSAGCSVGVMQDGQFMYRRGYGMGNLEVGVPLSADSVFYIASLSKQFTAAAIALLVIDGRLGLDDALVKYVPQLPQAVYGGITVQHLLHHTSGVRDYLELIELSGRHTDDVLTDDDVLDLLARQQALNHPPGEKFLYSNSNYWLLGRIVQKVTGHSLRQYAQSEIFQPLGMSSTQFRDDRSIIVKNRVSGHVPMQQGGFSVHHTSFDRVGDGGILTSVNDLLLWDRNFYADKLRNGALPRMLLTQGRLSDGSKLDYALGLTVGEYRGARTINHWGGFNGFVADLMRFPEQKFSVAVLCNTYGPGPSTIARQIADVYLGDRLGPIEPDDSEAWSSSPSVAVPATELHDKVGQYRNPETGTVWTIGFEHGQLIAEVQAARFPLEPLGALRFRSIRAPVKAALEFRRATDWTLRVYVPGQKPATFERITEAPALSPAQRAAYVGDYYGEELDVTWDVRIRNDELVLRIKHAFEAVLAPVGRDVFRTQEGATLRFARDAGTRVAGMSVDGARALNLRFVKLKSPQSARR